MVHHEKSLSEESRIKENHKPGTVAMCCKPSSGGRYCFDGYTLERLGSTPSHEEWQPPQGDPTKQPLYQGAEIKPEERKPEEPALH